MSNWVEYKNGNYNVKFNLDDGTKIRETGDDKFIASFAENCDVSLTYRCKQNCKFCYMGCTPEGKHADIMSQKWIHSLHPYTELALNGNDLDHPQLDEFLEFLKSKKVIANITINQNQFMEHLDKINLWYRRGLIHGLGVSLVNPTNEFILEIQKYPNAVIHTINGLLTPVQIEKLANNNLKILILGYKELERGMDFKNNNSTYIKYNQRYIKNHLSDIVNKFAVISFDNLCLEQLDVKNSGILSEDEWNEFYMGDDGTVTYFIDAITEEFAMNSVSQERYPLLDTVDEMFERMKVK